MKDHNTLLPTSSIGDCVVEYQGLLPNQMSDKWIPLQGVKRGEIHVQITKKVPEQQVRQSLDLKQPIPNAQKISSEVRTFASCFFFSFFIRFFWDVILFKLQIRTKFTGQQALTWCHFLIQAHFTKLSCLSLPF